MSNRKSRREQKDEKEVALAHLRASERIVKSNNRARNFDSLVKYTGISLCVAVFCWATAQFAGTTSKVEGLEEFFKSMNGIIVAIAGSGGVASAGTAWWMTRKSDKLRKDDIERLAPRSAELEKKLDPGRTSTSLTKRGEPEDT